MPLVENGLSRSGTTAQRPTNAEIGQNYFDTTLGVDLIYTADGWKPAGGFFAKEVTFTETAGAGTYTGSVTIPAGATIQDIVVYGDALWDNAGTAVLKVGIDAVDDDGYFTAVNLKATDLLAGESLSFALAGGKAGADIANSQVQRRYRAAESVVSGIITTSSTGGTAGRTRMTVIYSLPTITAAVKA